MIRTFTWLLILPLFPLCKTDQYFPIHVHFQISIDHSCSIVHWCQRPRVNYSLCVPWHFMRPMAFYASHGFLCVNQSFINTAFNTDRRVYSRFATHANSMDQELLLLLRKSANLYILSCTDPNKMSMIKHWKCCTVWSCSIRHLFYSSNSCFWKYCPIIYQF